MRQSFSSDQLPLSLSECVHVWEWEWEWEVWRTVLVGECMHMREQDPEVAESSVALAACLGVH